MKKMALVLLLGFSCLAMSSCGCVSGCCGCDNTFSNTYIPTGGGCCATSDCWY